MVQSESPRPRELKLNPRYCVATRRDTRETSHFGMTYLGSRKLRLAGTRGNFKLFLKRG